IGMGDNIFLGDRDGVRVPMQWTGDRNGGFSRANPQRLILPVVIDPEYHYESVNVESQQNNPNSLLWWMKRLIALRKQFVAFGRGAIEFLSPENPRVLAFVRRQDDEQVLVVANLSRFAQFVELDLAQYRGFSPVELFGRTRFPAVGDKPYLLTLDGHAFHWFALERPPSDAQAVQAASYAPPALEVSSDVWQALLDPPDPELERALPRYLVTRRWFERPDVRAAAVRHAYALPDAPVVLTVVRVDYVDADPEAYLLPLAFVPDARLPDVVARAPHAVVATVRIAAAGGEPLTGALVDAFADPAAAAGLVDFVAHRGRVEHRGTELLGEPLPALEGILSGEPPPPRASTPQAPDVRITSLDGPSASLAVRDQVFLKIRRRVDPGVNPDLEVGAFLAARAPNAVPTVLGALGVHHGRGLATTLGVLLSYVPNDGTAFRHALGELGRYYEHVLTAHRDDAPPPLPSASPVRAALSREFPAAAEELLGPYRETAAAIGTLVGDIHVALASDTSDPAFAPEPHTPLDQRSVY
ncbi:MAG TPA: alpha-glucosidase C-terminal domain-containing protein, partial [Minicystis sp.]|nr:alpha-glucosidase C-terminal domain-containing protein [Minicystis sp.]